MNDIGDKSCDRTIVIQAGCHYNLLDNLCLIGLQCRRVPAIFHMLTMQYMPMVFTFSI